MKDDPHYSQLLVQGVGIETYLALPIDAQKAYCAQEDLSDGTPGEYKPKTDKDGKDLDVLVATLGCGLAGASRGDTNGDLVEQVVTAYDHNHNLASGLDAKMSVPQAEYDTTFIVELAERMEERVDASAVYFTPTVGPGVKPDEYFVGASTNPMAGPLSAMGNNPEAALEYLAPSDKNPAMVVGPDGTLTVPLEGSEYDPNANRLTSTGRHTTGRQRMDLLLSMKDTDKEALTAALSGVSANRGDDNGAVDHRATWASGYALKTMQDWDIRTMDAGAKRNIGTFVINFGGELTNMGGEKDSPTYRADWKTATIPDSVIPADQQGKAIDALIKGIVDDDDAVSAAGQGAFNYSQRWADKEAKHELTD
ncbi:hypothetical protein CHIBA101_1257 [Actinomyces sp. Chiba101]|uniref:DUF6571 domain-containing protein n=1 Tax=Actinomyces denticolens TaxID=52767 RepID=A0ABY1I5Y4_9ACTO|nr:MULTISPECIES: DUF6571 family protein [Actinomyces]BAW93115.1 hypothetical protein CHIBA101_1257 [Actinomyces sp. Chiba101]GAV95654.1 hypothetical protein ADENT20671_2453 [Actinomyces denticolens]SHI64910.1 hypothetical protein SAMN05216246_103239 [Actinomyces denticolens]SUU04931.1 Uncharacterised protein [Actinomyces denticolens]